MQDFYLIAGSGLHPEPKHLGAKIDGSMFCLEPTCLEAGKMPAPA